MSGILPLSGPISSNIYCISSDSEHPCRQISNRMVTAVKVPISIIVTAIDSCIGIAASITSIVTLGTYQKALGKTGCLFFTRKIIALPYAFVLRTLNPQAKFLEMERDGIVHHDVAESLVKIAKEYHEAKHRVIPRLIYALYAVLSVITRVVDGIIGVIAMIASFLTVGKFEKINTLAFQGLQTPAIIHDFFWAIIKCINPNAGN